MPKVTQTDPYLFTDASSYDAQNKLLRQYKFPYEYSKKDRIDSVYSDRITEIKENEFEKANPRGQYLDNFATSTDIAILNKWMVQLAEKVGFGEITGWRIVRFTHKISGYPLYRYDFHYTTNEKLETYSENFAPNVKMPEFNNTMYMY